MDILLIALAIVGLFIVLQVIRLYAVVTSVTRVQVKNADYELRTIDDLPTYLSDLAKAYGEELCDLGFSLSHCQLVDGPFSHAHPRWQLVYLDASRKTYATLTIPTLPDQANLCRVDFETLFSDGQSLNTLNGLSHAIIGELPGVTLLDPYAATIKEQLATHLTALAGFEEEKTPIILVPTEFVAAAQQSSDNHVSKLQSDGLVKRQNGTYVPSLATAVRYVFRFLIGSRKAKRLHRQRDKSVESTVAVPLEVEVESFQQLASQTPEPKRSSRIGKTALLLVTLLLFALSLGFSMSFRFLVTLILALLIHETGHVLGMYLFKYRDPTILFLPFLGAVATGLPENAKPHQKLIVFFLGPVPGIVLGAACWILSAFTGSEVARDAATILLALNYFNLLPIMPLDGGQIVNLVLFSRFPLAQGVFQVVSLVLLAAISLCSGTYALLAISVYGLIVAPRLFRRGKLLNELRKRMGGMNRVPSEEDVLLEAFGLMREKPFDGWPFETRCQMAQHAVENLNTGFPSWKTVALSLSSYVALFVLPVIVLGAVWVMAIVQSWAGFNLWSPFSPSWPEPALQQPLGNGDTLLISHMGELGNIDLYLIDDVNGLRPIVEGKGFSAEPVWSPSGAQFAYVSYGRDESQCHIVEADGDSQSQIPVDSDSYISMLQWSPDGSRLAGVTYDFTDGDTASTVSQLCIIEIATRETLELLLEGNVADFAWLPDGESLLVIVRVNDAVSIATHRMDGSHEQRPTDVDHLRDAIYFAISPDATRVAYTITPEDATALNTSVYVSSLDGSATKVANDLSWGGEIAWSPDSTRIAFVALTDDYHNALYVVNADGTDSQQLALLDTGDESGEILPSPPAWSPDGTRIAIGSFIGKDGSAIFVVRADGTEQRQITNASGYIYALAWRPRR